EGVWHLPALRPVQCRCGPSRTGGPRGRTSGVRHLRFGRCAGPADRATHLPGMIVALDSSTLTLSLALGRAGEPAPVASERHGPPAKVSDLLPGALLGLLARAGLTLDDVRGFVVGLGPGSFTGLRIGLATVKGLAYARRLPVSGASSLAALALE